MQETRSTALSDFSQAERFSIGAKTFRFVDQLRKDPAVWSEIQRRAEQIRSEGR